MPRIDFNKVEDAQDFSPLPEGTYPCRLAEVEETTTHSGAEMWKARFEITEGQYKGRYLFDNLVFNDQGLKRVKLLCTHMGLEVSGELDLTPETVTGRTCGVAVIVEDYESDEGKTKARNKVPFAGFYPYDETASEAAQETEGDKDDLAF